MNQTQQDRCPVAISGWDHVGIRVSDRQQALAFYQRLGFVETLHFAGFEANEMLAPGGVRINLIFNGSRLQAALNPLLDQPVKLPGVTHPAFVVPDLYALRDWLQASGIRITEDIHAIGPRRITLFIRDPDGNVLEFNQLLDNAANPTASITTKPLTQRKTTMKLYDLELSGNCYKVRLLAALAQLPLQLEAVDFLAGAHKQAPVIDLNPWGELPVLVDGDLVLRDSQAILVYLARQYAGHAWWPEDAARQGEVMQWLSVAANEIQHGPCTARLIDKFGYELDKARALQIAARIHGLLEQHLATHEWLACGRPTIAECAVFPYVALAHEGGISLQDYPNILAWIERVKALPGFSPMPGI